LSDTSRGKLASTGGRRHNVTGENFWARGYFVSTMGLEENIGRVYIRNQEEERYEQINFEIYTRRLGRLMLLWRL